MDIEIFFTFVTWWWNNNHNLSSKILQNLGLKLKSRQCYGEGDWIKDRNWPVIFKWLQLLWIYFIQVGIPMRFIILFLFDKDLWCVLYRNFPLRNDFIRTTCYHQGQQLTVNNRQIITNNFDSIWILLSWRKIKWRNLVF